MSVSIFIFSNFIILFKAVQIYDWLLIFIKFYNNSLLQNGHCVNFSHGGESDETINQMNDSEVSPDIESFNNSLLPHDGESNGSISQMNTSEDMPGNQIPFPIPVSSAIDSLTETDSVPNAGQTVSCGSQEAGISGRPLHEDDTVRKMLWDRTQKSQESRVFEEPNETDKLLHCPERVPR